PEQLAAEQGIDRRDDRERQGAAEDRRAERQHARRAEQLAELREVGQLVGAEGRAADGRPEVATQSREAEDVVEERAGGEAGEQRRYFRQPAPRLQHRDDRYRRDQQAERLGVLHVLQRVNEGGALVEAEQVAELDQHEEQGGGVLE